MAFKSSLERLAETVGLEGGTRKIGRTTLVRFCLYFGIVIPLISTIILLTETMRPTGKPQPADLFSGFWAPLVGELPPLAFGAAAVVGAFLLAIPVAFVYVRTRNRLEYDQSLVQTVIMLPVVVTSILIVVDRKSTRLNSSHIQKSRMPSSA